MTPVEWRLLAFMLVLFVLFGIVMARVIGLSRRITWEIESMARRRHDGDEDLSRRITTITAQAEGHRIAHGIIETRLQKLECGSDLAANRRTTKHRKGMA